MLKDLKNKFIIGIDPGRNGGICGLTNGKINIIDKMPPNPADMWGYFIDDLGVPMIISQNRKENIHVFIEDVHSMPTDGVKSAFTFGRGLGWFDMLFARFDIHPERILPRDWQSLYGLHRDNTGEESKYNYKKRILAFAKDVVPKDQEKNITLATCDAFLIALYGFNQLKEKLQSNGKKKPNENN